MSEGSILSRWRRPDRDTLLENVYKCGTPNFDPFPTVTDVMNAAHCSVAAVHNILYGRDNALIEGSGREIGMGRLFHEFISHLKSEISAGRRFRDIPQIRYLYENFARYEDERKRIECWQYYIEPWCRRKLNEISKIPKDTNAFFEVSVANAYVPFSYEQGERTYPLMGKIDEVNIENRVLIERTTMGKPNDDHPPRLKDYQLWLLWKVLCSIDNEKYPEIWRNINFDDFNLIVETPYRDFLVKKDNPEFERLTHTAYAWIHDILFERRGIHEAYERRSCTFLNQMEDCGLRWLCYGRRRPRPFRTVREEMHSDFRRIYVLLAYELLWSKHLFRYQLTMLDRSTLEELGLTTSGRILNFENGNLEIELEPQQMERFLAQRIAGELGGYYIVFGSFFVGVKLKGAFVEQKGENRVIINTTNVRVPHSSTALIVQTDPEISTYIDQPWFLTEWLQRDLYSLESWGLERDDRATSNPTIRLLEAIFGVDRLCKGGNNARQ
ncbi:MAG: hypothetical protein QXW82_06580 [Candidatus Bathyarchaeia archaeon]